MQVSYATEPASPESENEDFFAGTSKVAVLLDGVGTPAGAEDGCCHGVPWFVRQLGIRCLDAASDESKSLTDALRSAIKHVADMHAHRCDLSHPGSPSSTVILLREGRKAIEYLVLADSVLVVSGQSGTIAITDDREAEFAVRYRPPPDMLGRSGEEHDEAIRQFV